MTDSVIVWPEATERLATDPTFGPLVRSVGSVRMEASRGTPFASLARAIVHQQLAGAAAGTIHGRFVQAVGGEVTPAAVLATSEAALRGAGLSRSKAASIRELAERADGDELELDRLAELSDVEIREELTRVRGIGPWTAEMFLIFSLRRPDVWPVGDLGVRQGMGRLLGWSEPPTAQELALVGVGYRPWRSAAAWYCWRAMETPAPGVSSPPE